jgi:Type II secretion system (T2SS), protein K
MSATPSTPSAPTSIFGRAWHTLTVPVGRRVRNGKGAPHGVALLTVMIALALMSAIVSDLGTNEFIRFRLASNDRDAMKAEALAESGTQVARLILSMQSAVQPCINQLSTIGIPLPAHTFWQLIPMDSEVLKGLTSGELQSAVGLDVSRAVAERKAKHEEDLQTLTSTFDTEAEGVGKTPFQAPEAGFGFFDGEFKVEVVDEEQKAASLRGWQSATTPQQRYPFAARLFHVIQPERFDWLFEERAQDGNRVDRCQFVAGMYDWLDDNADATDGCADINSFGRNTVGAEDSQYSFSATIQPRNAYPDSQGELRLMLGMNEANLRAFGDQISIYGEGKINLLSAPDGSIEALVVGCAQQGEPLVQNELWMKETIAMWREATTLGALGGGIPITADGFVQLLDTRGMVAQPACKEMISLESKNFTVRSTATVGEVTRIMTTVMRLYGSTEELYYYSIR